MAQTDIITDPYLQSVVQLAAQAREQSLAILDLIDTFHSTNPSDLENEQLMQLSKQQKHLTAYLAQLRSANRKTVVGVRQTKQETAEARQEVDSLHLELQNLYYEQRHLRGEIEACESYDHTYERIDMLPAEEFLELHPEHAGLSEHDLTVARIRDEEAQRAALEEERKSLVKTKDALVKSTGAQNNELAKLDTEFEKWIAGEGAVRKLLEAREKKTADG